MAEATGAPTRARLLRAAQCLARADEYTALADQHAAAGEGWEERLRRATADDYHARAEALLALPTSPLTHPVPWRWRHAAGPGEAAVELLCGGPLGAAIVARLPYSPAEPGAGRGAEDDAELICRARNHVTA
jgi:hypothetical protein